MGKQRPSTIKSQCTKVTASDRTLLSLSRILFHSNYSKVSTANLMQIMSEAVISSTEENSSSCVYRFPLTICTPAYAQTISLCDHYYKSRKFLKKKKKKKKTGTVPNIHSENPKQCKYTRPEGVK
jgi:hypothetical protein